MRGISAEYGITELKQKFMMTRRKVALTLLILLLIVAIVATIGWIWLGWVDIAKNRRILNSLPVPPGVERIYVGSNGNTRDEVMITPPERWSTRATFKFHNYTQEYLQDFYISRLSPEWEYCTQDIPQGQRGSAVRFSRNGSLVALDTSRPPSSQGPNYYGIFVRHDNGRPVLCDM